LFSGVSALRAHQTRLDVIGNNIANVNTIGFKSSRVTFKEMFSQNMRTASTPSPQFGGIGGMNPMQVGLGVSLGSIDMSMTPSNLENTSNKSDLAIDGKGYFVLRVGDSSQLIYTRAGNFTRDGAGFLVHTGTGNRLQGYMLSNPKDIDSISGSISDIQIPFEDAYEPTATTMVEMAGNLNSMAEPKMGMTADGDEGQIDNWVSQIDVFDRLGQKHQILATFMQAEEPNPEEPVWRVTLTMLNPYESIEGETDAFELTFGPNGLLAEGFERYQEYTLTNNGDGPEDPEEYGPHIGGFPEETIITIDWGGITQFAGKTDAFGRRLDGNEYGKLTNWEIDENGTLTLFYSNGERRNHARIALALFPNDQGLTKLSDTTWQESNNSGAAVISLPNSGEFGKTRANSVEMSNVDLAYEFTNLVITQRGYQANARVISTSDEILQELVNIKR